MAPRLFHRLRRCRALFALALCAWLALAGGMAWARQDCCAGMPEGGSMAATMHAGMHAAMSHGAVPHGDTDHAHAGCTCAQLCAAVAPLAQARPAFVFAAAGAWRPAPPMTPQPDDAPPLRPPLAA